MTVSSSTHRSVHPSVDSGEALRQAALISGTTLRENQLAAIYDWDLACEEIAAQRRQVVVVPRDDELQIDIDSEEAWVEFNRRLLILFSDHDFRMTVSPSRSGLPKRHVTLVFPGCIFSNPSRIMLQAALGDDPMRVVLSARRDWVRGETYPSKLFENPEALIQIAPLPTPPALAIDDDILF